MGRKQKDRAEETLGTGFSLMLVVADIPIHCVKIARFG
jgi:hypothetical protein